jgi:hypothetical protein
VKARFNSTGDTAFAPRVDVSRTPLRVAIRTKLDSETAKQLASESNWLQ